MTPSRHRRIAASQPAPSFDHLVGADQDGLRDREPESFGCTQIDGYLELGRRLNRKVARLLTPKDAVDIGCRAPKLVGYVNTVRYQAAGADVGFERVDGGQAISLWVVGQ